METVATILINYVIKITFPSIASNFIYSLNSAWNKFYDRRKMNVLILLDYVCAPNVKRLIKKAVNVNNKGPQHTSLHCFRKYALFE